MTTRNDTNDIIEIDLFELFMYMLRRWYTFAIATLVTTAAGLMICIFLITPQYESTTKIIILNRQNSGALTYSDMQLASQLTKDYEELISSRDVLEKVIEDCGLDLDYEHFLKRIEVENVTDTRIISIAVRDPSPAQAQQIANHIRETAAEHIRRVTDVEAVNVVEEANYPDEIASPSYLLWTVLSAAAGFVLVLIIQTARFMLDDTIKSSDDVERYLGLTTLALIPWTEEMDVPRKQPAKKQKPKSAKTARANSTGRAAGGTKA